MFGFGQNKYQKHYARVLERGTERVGNSWDNRGPNAPHTQRLIRQYDAQLTRLANRANPPSGTVFGNGDQPVDKQQQRFNVVARTLAHNLGRPLTLTEKGKVWLAIWKKDASQ